MGHFNIKIVRIVLFILVENKSFVSNLTGTHLSEQETPQLKLCGFLAYNNIAEISLPIFTLESQPIDNISSDKLIMKKSS